MKRGAWLLMGTLLLTACGEKEPQGHWLTGLIDADEVDVASKVPGRILELRVREGDRVKRGQGVVTLELLEIEARLEQVRAAIDAARAKLGMAQKGARFEERVQAKKALAAAHDSVEVNKKMLTRASTLLEQKAISQAKFDEIEFRHTMASEQFSIAQARYNMVMNGARDEEIQALEALVKQGEGTLQEVNVYEQEGEQKSPLDGEVSKVILHQGELAGTGAPILTVVDIDNCYATFAVREDLLLHVGKGSRIEAEIPALKKNATFEVFALAVMGDFATWRATSEKDQFDMRSFEVKARPVTPIEGLRPGMTVRWRVPESK